MKLRIEVRTHDDELIDVFAFEARHWTAAALWLRRISAFLRHRDAS